MITIADMTDAIKERAEERYSVEFYENSEIEQLCLEFDAVALKLKRINRGNAGVRTLLITSSSTENAKIHETLSWAADVRDLLPEPQASDLYMIMLINGVAAEHAARIETDDRFCRKFVAREQESAYSVLDRSFLAELSPADNFENINDPLIASLNQMAQRQAWIAPELRTVRDMLLSGESGADIATHMMDILFGNKESE